MNSKNGKTSIKLIFFFSLYLLLSCKNEKNNELVNENNTLKVKFNSVMDDTSYFSYRITDYLLYPLKEKYPKYYDKLKGNYQNIPNNDSLLIVSHSFQIEKQYYDLYKSNSLTNKGDLKRAAHFFKVFDTTNFLANNFSNKINVATWFKSNKQRIIIDTNNDNDFGDENIFVFNTDFKFINNVKPNPRLIDTLQIINFKHQVFFNNKIVNIKRKIQVFPYPNYWMTQMYKNNYFKKFALLLKFKDYLKGHIKNDKIGYTFRAQGYYFPRMTFIITPDTAKIFNNNIINYEYRFKDTISLFGKLYKFDSIGENLSEIYLNKINPTKKFYNYRMGYYLKDFQVVTLEKESLKLSAVITNKKEYILLDFWGTWCVPCKELTPRLKKLHKELGKDVQIIGVAYDKSLDKVKEYINEKEMNWSHIYLDKNKSGINRDLKIKSYPTFILLNKNRKILYRGSGEFSLNKIEKIIKQKSPK